MVMYSTQDLEQAESTGVISLSKCQRYVRCQQRFLGFFFAKTVKFYSRTSDLYPEGIVPENTKSKILSVVMFIIQHTCHGF